MPAQGEELHGRIQYTAKEKAPVHPNRSFSMRRKGFEPPTYWFVASYSIQLSYRRM